jgi:RNA-directed DNA polymerase
MLEAILERRNIEKAMKAVERNHGAGGIDTLQSDELRPFVNANCQCLIASIQSGSYKPQAVRMVEIPKTQGGTRKLGIPSVVDRMLQQAIHQWLSPQYEVEFNENSFGFRPNKNARQAVLKAQEYLNLGYTRVIELDLENFFDKVNHQKLLNLLSKRIADKRTLELVKIYLRCGIMEDGVVSQRLEGTPQGSPLSPLLSNILLNELDKELSKRGHKFIRYADDCSIYVKSRKSAERVLSSITHYIEQELLLKVNSVKTRISPAQNSSLLGFSFYKDRSAYQIRVSNKSLEKIKEKCKQVTKSKDPTPEHIKLSKLDKIIRGWVNYFSIAKAKQKMVELDEMVRTRLRISTWRRWKRIRTKVKNLLKLGVSKSNAYQWGNTSKGACRIAHSPILFKTLNKGYWHSQNYIGFHNYYYWQTEKQQSLF